MLEEIQRDESWIEAVKKIENPFGRGDSGQRIASIVAELFGARKHEIEQGAGSAA
jgi:hypothetical protein